MALLLTVATGAWAQDPDPLGRICNPTAVNISI